MVEFLLVVLIVTLVIRWAVLRDRWARIERRLEELSAASDGVTRAEHVVELTRRVWRLEQEQRAAPPPAEPVQPAAPRPAPVPLETVPAPPEPVCAPPPPPLEPVHLPPTPEAPEPVYLPPPAPPAPTLGERLRAVVGNEEWEALVGGSLLNKIGALVLVIGIALFLAYSFAHMTPAGRTLTAFLSSAALLGLGVRLERKQTYRVFSLGFIGAGWAGLYLTVYAMYAVPAARVIDKPFLGSLLLLAVAAGMIGHSLRYRAQTVTALAYFTAFAALAVTPATPFAVVALIPLAATLLYLAWRFAWHGMAVFGLLATYATCISRGSSDAPLVLTESLFVTYWLLFEGFDLLRTWRRDTSRAAALIFPLNAAGFLGLSYLAWSTRAPNDLWLMSAIAAALYLAGALARYKPGGYEAPLTLSALLAGLAVVGKTIGVWMAVGLAIEAEILYLAGIRLGSRFLRALGWVGFLFSMERLFLVDVYRDQRSLLFGREIHNWTPPALFHAALFYLNRFLHRPAVAFSWLASGLVALAVGVEAPPRFIGATWLLVAVALFEFGLWRERREFRLQAYCIAGLGVFAILAVHLAANWPLPWIPVSAGLAIAYGYALRASRLGAGPIGARENELLAWGGASATLFLGLLLLHKLVPAGYLGLAWCLFALVLFELGLRRFPEHLRMVSYAAGAIATLTVVLSQAYVFSKFAPAPVWISYFGAGISAWAVAARARIASAAALGDADERAGLCRICPALGTLFLLAGIWILVPSGYLGLAWTLFALVLFELGLRRWPGNVRPVAYAVGAVATLTVVLSQAGAFSKFAPAPVWISYFGAGAAAWAMSARAVFASTSELNDAVERAFVRRVSTALGTIFTLTGIWIVAPRSFVPVAWVVAALVLLLLSLHWESYWTAALAFLHVWIANFPSGEMIGDVSARLAATATVAAVLYAAEFLSARQSWARTYFSVLATLLVAGLLGYEVSGSVLTVAWGVQGLLLLGAGFPAHERPLRLSGLALLLFCISKLFIYDLRHLETLYRILAFVALGVILLGVSWIYTRFRDTIRRGLL